MKSSAWQTHIERLRDEHDAKVKTGDLTQKDTKPWIECPECGVKGTIRRGKKLGTYFTHKFDTQAICENQDQWYLHKEARRRLCEFLNAGGICNFSSEGVDEIGSLPTGLTYRTQFKVNGLDSDFDIAGLNEEGVVMACIDLKSNCKPEIFTDRSAFTWFVVEVSQVLRKLNNSKRVIEITLKDVKN